MWLAGKSTVDQPLICFQPDFSASFDWGKSPLLCWVEFPQGRFKGCFFGGIYYGFTMVLLWFYYEIQLDSRFLEEIPMMFGFYYGFTPNL